MNPSITSAPMMRCLDQPMAERMPISRVRSSTAMSSVFSTMSTPMNSATQAMADDTALSSPIRLSFCSTPPLPGHRELAQALDGLGDAVGFATIPGLVELDRYEGHRAGAEGDLLQIGELDDDGVTIDDRGSSW